MTSVERIQAYTRLAQEADAHTKGRMPPDWPRKGDIIIRNLNLQYPYTDSLSLRDINVEIHANEKVFDISNITF